MKISPIFAALMLSVSLSGHAALITSPADSALTGAELIDFDSAPAGAFASLTLGSVEFSTTQFAQIDSAFAGSYNTRGQKYLDNTNNGYSNVGSILKFSFNEPTRAFGFNWGASDTQWTLSAYDSANNLLESHLLPITYSSNAGDFVGIKANGTIGYAILQTATPNDWVFVDNFSVSAVPEPETYAMLLAGLGMLGAARRGKKK